MAYRADSLAPFCSHQTACAIVAGMRLRRSAPSTRVTECVNATFRLMRTPRVLRRRIRASRSRLRPCTMRTSARSRQDSGFVPRIRRVGRLRDRMPAKARCARRPSAIRERSPPKSRLPWRSGVADATLDATALAPSSVGFATIDDATDSIVKSVPSSASSTSLTRSCAAAPKAPTRKVEWPRGCLIVVTASGSRSRGGRSLSETQSPVRELGIELATSRK